MKTATSRILLVLSLAAPAATEPALCAAQPQGLPRTRPIKVKTPKPVLDRFRGQVLNFTSVAITVRDRNNTTLVRTFRYSPELERKLENRYMENGDRVAVRFLKGSDTAVKLEGKIRRHGSPFVPSRR